MLVPDPLLIFWLIMENSHCMLEFLLKITYFKRELSKSLKKSLFFLLNPFPFNGQDYEKQKDIKQDNIKWFLVYSKNCICQFMQVNS